MDDIIFKTKGKETFRIPFPTPGTKCPETKLEVKEMTEYQPTPQTPEQVDEGLRNAFRQAMKDGVMDATPYLKQMNSNKEIELLKQEIKMLKSKLSLLEELEKTKSPVEEAYKEWWGQYPELETDSKYDDMRWQGFQAGFQAAYEEKVREDDYYNEVITQKNTEPQCPDEPEYYDEVEWDEKDNPKPMDEVVNRLVRKYEAQKLFNRLVDELGYDFDACNDVVDLVEDWLPKEQSAAGSQNVDTELLVDGFNHCLQKMKEMLR